jgi:DNA-binding MarR family transcriptional regulator
MIMNQSTSDKATIAKIKRILEHRFTLPVLASIAEGKRPSQIAKKRLNISDQLVHYHLKRLIEAGFVIKLGNPEGSGTKEEGRVIRNIKRTHNNGISNNCITWQLTEQGQLVLKGLLRQRVKGVRHISDSTNSESTGSRTNRAQLSLDNNLISKRGGRPRQSVRLHDIRVSFPLLFVPESFISQATPLNNGVLRLTDKRPERTIEAFWKSASIELSSVQSTGTRSSVAYVSDVNQNDSEHSNRSGEQWRAGGQGDRNDIKEGCKAVLLVHVPPRYFSDPLNGCIAQYDLARKYAKAQTKGWGMQIFDEGIHVAKPHLAFSPDPAILFLSQFETAAMETRGGVGKAWFDQSTGKTEQETDDVDYTLKALQVPETVSDILLLSNNIIERLDRLDRLFNGYERHYDPCLTLDN